MVEDKKSFLIDLLNEHIEPLRPGKSRFNSLLEKIGDARIVAIGESTHGTQEFYQTRIEITKELITQKNFNAIAIEGDWPDAYAIHSYIQGSKTVNTTDQALKNFHRFPKWMWRNTTIPPFLKWLREKNATLAKHKKIGFYGLDLYSMNESMRSVIDYLDIVDPDAAQRARQRYACLDHNSDPQSYGYLVNTGIKKHCVQECVDQMLELQNHANAYSQQDKKQETDNYFAALLNARVVKDAEKYYRSMFEGKVSTWNLRDQHMADTLNSIIHHLDKINGQPTKVVIWAHNSHVGDARATEAAEQGELNIGQLVREQFDTGAYLIGFSTHEGYVTAADDWDAPANCKKINPGFQESYEELFHQLKEKNFILHLSNNKNLEEYLQLRRLQRAIGVIYRPETERLSHYFFTRLPYQFDSLIHIDRTTPLEPLDINQEWEYKAKNKILDSIISGTISKEKKMAAKYGKSSQKEVENEMRRYKKGTATSGKGKKRVKSREQAIAIALSKSRKKGGKVPKKKTKSSAKKGSSKKSSRLKSASSSKKSSGSKAASSSKKSSGSKAASSSKKSTAAKGNSERKSSAKKSSRKSNRSRSRNSSQSNKSLISKLLGL